MEMNSRQLSQLGLTPFVTYGEISGRPAAERALSDETPALSKVKGVVVGLIGGVAAGLVAGIFETTVQHPIIKKLISPVAASLTTIILYGIVD